MNLISYKQPAYVRGPQLDLRENLLNQIHAVFFDSFLFAKSLPIFNIVPFLKHELSEFPIYKSNILTIKIFIKRINMFFLNIFKCNELTFFFIRQCRFISL